jgi:hypothetical protein
LIIPRRFGVWHRLFFLLFLLIAPRQHGAGHQLYLVEHHQRQHHNPHGSGREQDIGHRDTVRQAFLRTAEHDGDLIGFTKAQPARHVSVHHQHDRQQHQAGDDDKHQRTQPDLMPDTVGDGFAEGRVNHQQDRSLIGLANQLTVAFNPFTNQRARQVTGHKGH